MPDQDDFIYDAVWITGEPPRLPAFAAKSPPTPPVITSCDGRDVVTVSIGNGPPELMRCDRLVALLREGKTTGQIHVGRDGINVVASFATLRNYLFGPG